MRPDFWRQPRQRLPLLHQTEESECGLASLAMVAAYHGHRCGLAELRQRFPISRKGATLLSLMQIAEALQLECRPLRLDIEAVPELKLPCILHWDMNHFVVLARVDRRLTVHDPATGLRNYSWAEFAQHFTGVALELSPCHQFVAQPGRPRASLRSLIGPIVGLKRSLAQMLALAFGMEILALAMPFYLQWTIDQALATHDTELLTALGLGFALMVVLHAGIGAARNWLVARLSVSIDFQWLGHVFAHLLRLPLAYFERRHTGAILSYFSSINHIQETLTSTFAQTFVDGFLALGTLAMMLLYSPPLAMLALASVTLYGLLRWGVFGALREANAEHIVFDARQSTHFLETVRGVQSVRLFGRAQLRKVGWMHMLAEKFNATLKIQKISITQQAASSLLLGLERVLMIWLAALAVTRQEFSIGMLIAFVSYREQFSSRVIGLLDKLFELRMLGLHAERVADVVHTPAEDDSPPECDTSTLDASIELRHIGFGYAATEEAVLSDISLHIAAGECVAITGASGCGKTTLVKILLGLFEPDTGTVHVGGCPLSQLGLGNYRKMVGTVMQDDLLFTGSIRDNISFFDPEPDLAWAEECADLAAIHSEILAMPMGYESLVGDIGSSLSGGQKQRILLARALYKRPRILVLDEATSQLDVLNERSVNDAIRQMNLTRIVIAHRPETIAMAPRVIVLAHGRIERDLGRAHNPSPGNPIKEHSA